VCPPLFARRRKHQQRQPQGPHAHQIKLDPWGKQFAFVSDLGADKIFVYRYGRDSLSLRGASSSPLHYSTAHGAGPRHLDFNVEHKLVYQLNELDATLGVLAFDTDTGGLKQLQCLRTLPAGVQPLRAGHRGSADVHVRPDGQFVYCSNRTDHSIAIFKVSAVDGRLEPIGTVRIQTSTRTARPRAPRLVRCPRL